MGNVPERTVEIHEMYKKSHNQYAVSERINRNYVGFDAEKSYGENTGKHKILLGPF